MAFFAGAWGCDKSVCLRPSMRSFPQSCAVMSKFVQNVYPTFRFNSVAVFKDVQTQPHRDTLNDSVCNLLIPLSVFEGGEIWVEDPDGNHEILHRGRRILGKLLDVSAGPVLLQAQRALHCTMPWHGGSRVILVVFSSSPARYMSATDLITLTQLGYYDPETSSTDNPPPALFATEFPEMQPYLNLSASGGFTAAIRKAGMQRSVGVDSKPPSNARCPILLFDLCADSGQELLWQLLDNPDIGAIHLAPPCGTLSQKAQSAQ